MSVKAATIALADEPAPAAVERPAGLPDRAELLVDGSVDLRLSAPDLAILRTQRAGEGVHEDRFTSVRLYRLTGKDLRDSLKAATGEEFLVLFAGASRMGLAKARALYDAMDARDCLAVNRVLRFLSGAGEMTGT